MRLLLFSCCLVVFFAGCDKEEAPAVKKIRARFKNGLDTVIYNFKYQSLPDLGVFKIDSLKKGAYSDYIENPEIYQDQTATAPVNCYYSISIPGFGSGSGTSTLLSITPQKLFPRDYTIAIVYTTTGVGTKMIKFEFEK